MAIPLAAIAANEAKKIAIKLVIALVIWLLLIAAGLLFLLFATAGISTAACVSERASVSGELPEQLTYTLPPEVAEAATALQATYQRAEAFGVPWQLVAAVHYREGTNRPEARLRDGKALDGQTLAESVDEAAETLQAKAGASAPAGPQLSLTNFDFDLAGAALFGYNGVSPAYSAAASQYGHDPAIRPYMGSPYVMSRFNEKFDSMALISHDGGAPDATDSRPGALTIYIALLGGDIGGEECDEGEFMPTAGYSMPPNMGAELGDGYYRMPDDPQPAGTYAWNGATPPSDRCGGPELIGMIYTVAQRWKTSHPESTLLIGDLNAAAGHVSHMVGVDVDIMTTDRSAAHTSGSSERSVELAKMFFDTGIVEIIGYQDSYVISELATYGRDQNLPGSVAPWTGHGDHFHVRIAKQFSLPSRGSC